MSSSKTPLDSYDELLGELSLNPRGISSELTKAELVELANKFKFFQRIRVLIDVFERDWACSFSNEKFVQNIRAKYKKDNHDKLEEESLAYRKWSWILHFTAEAAVPEVRLLRDGLSRNRDQYHNFARSIEAFCNTVALIYDNGMESFDERNFKEMIYLIAEPIRKDISLFLECVTHPSIYLSSPDFH